ncbi:glycosyltransferase family 4 protein [Moritella viscosa]|uniref:glycosyltransferase family 4 protein n=1 Tax=Moritella viscosa TaxID=80854 RepID=UPI00406C8D6F
MTRPKKVAFIKMASFSHTNEKLLDALQVKFPSYEFDVIDVNDLISCRDPVCLLVAFFQYKKEILFGNKELMKCRTRTSFYMKRIRLKILKRLAQDQYLFTFQTQSLFDASTDSVPHFLYTDHTHLANLFYPGFDPKQLYRDSWTNAEKQIYHHATINFTMSSHVLTSIVEQYRCDPHDVVMARCGSHINPPDNVGYLEQRYEMKNILFVGVDWERKGGPRLIEAFKSVLKVHPDARLTIVGCSPDVDVENCKIVGAVPLAEVQDYYLQASLFCLPTRREPFGIVFLEAFAHKLPVVSNDLGALPDIVQEGVTGYLVGCNDTDLLAQRLITLLSEPHKCKEFGSRGYAYFLENYTWEKTAAIIAHHINVVLESKKG